jgi:hypothetical protein
MGEVKTTWFEPRRGRTGKGQLRRKKSVGNMAQKYPPRSTCVSYVTVNYDTVTTYQTVQIYQITLRNLNYSLQVIILWQMFVTNSYLPIFWL